MDLDHATFLLVPTGTFLLWCEPCGLVVPDLPQARQAHDRWHTKVVYVRDDPPLEPIGVPVVLHP